MKEKLKTAFKNPMLIVFLIIVIFFMPQALFSPGENNNRGVVTAVGIDKTGEEYEISFLVFVPTANQNFEEKVSIVSGKGNSIAQAVYHAQIAMGRKIGLYHAKTTVVSRELMQEEDIAQSIDYLGRVASLPENTIFICTDKTAKEILSSTQSLRDNLGFNLEQLISYNANHIYVTDTSLEAFYKGYFSPVKSSIIGFLTLSDKQEEGEFDMSVAPAADGASSSEKGVISESGGSSGDGQSGDGKNQIIMNTGECALVKEGKLVHMLSLDELNGINLLNAKSKNQVIKIHDVDIMGERVNVSYQIRNKRILKTTKFENGYPIFSVHIILDLEMLEIEGISSGLKVNTEFSEMTKETAKKIDIQLKNQFAQAIKILKQTSTDVIGVIQTFLRDCRNEYFQYIKNDVQEDEFIRDVTFKLNITVQTD